MLKIALIITSQNIYVYFYLYTYTACASIGRIRRLWSSICCSQNHSSYTKASSDCRESSLQRNVQYKFFLVNGFFPMSKLFLSICGLKRLLILFSHLIIIYFFSICSQKLEDTNLTGWRNVFLWTFFLFQ